MADKESKPKKPPARPRRELVDEPLAVVGIGVCLASLRSLQALFGGLSENLPAAYVIAVRQQDGLTSDTVVDAISAQTRMPVALAKQGDRLQPAHVYVGGGDQVITITDGHVGIRKSRQKIESGGTVDSLLISLAEHAKDRSIAVILTGLGSEGTAGVTATKEYGGLSIAQSINGESEAAENGAASPAGIVDLLLPIEQIASQIALYIRGLETLGSTEAEDQITDQVSEQLTAIASTLRTITGNDFHGYKRNTFLRRVQRRMQVVQSPSIEDYASRLKKDRDEVHHLFQDLLIGVTQFFRDSQEFDALQKELPRLFEGKGPNDQFRVWVLGCATGEEAYSIAILLAEYLDTMENGPTVQIFATDLDARALGAARAGRYAATIANHVGPERLARWFIKEGDTYCVAKVLREMCIFSPHNLIKDAPFSRIDLLSCRNLLIYLNSNLQDRVIPIFHFSLRPGGILFLGASENVTRHQKLFAPVDRKNRIFRRLETPTKILPEFPLVPRAQRSDAVQEKSGVAPARAAGLAPSIARRASHAAEKYAPAYVIVDADHEVLHFSGRTGRFLEPATGVASLNLFNLVHRDLRLDLRGLLHQAMETKVRAEHARIPISDNGHSTLANLIVEPIIEHGDLTALLILFQDAGPMPEASHGSRRSGESHEHVDRLEEELRLTKDRLQATIEELESTNEELKFSNEEYQSINEELQSSNEELETSKEELQSVNEELHTVNAELDIRVNDLARANSDLRNLLESTQIATIFLDNDLRVRSFTPAATDIFHLLETDVGRPLDHLGARVSYPELSEDVHAVLKKLGTVEREVSNREGGHYIARIHPYRSIDNYIAGAVLTFVDVTSTVKAEAALRASESQLRTLLAELQHRVRNTLAIVKSITTRTAEASSSVDEMSAHLVGRLDAFARVQSAVTRNPEGGVDLATIVVEELAAHAIREGEQLSLEGPTLKLLPKAAESISLAVHELVTNAIKHGPFGGNGGNLAVNWRVDGGNGAKRFLHFEWIERGLDSHLGKPLRQGFGMELLTRILPYNLGAKTDLKFNDGGIRFLMELPVEHVSE